VGIAYHDHSDGEQDPPAAKTLALLQYHGRGGCYAQQGGVPMDGLYKRLSHVRGDRLGGGGVVLWKGTVGMVKAPSGASSAELKRPGSARAFLVNTLPSAATTLRLCALALPPPSS
jgi:hypothetical protein